MGDVKKQSGTQNEVETTILTLTETTTPTSEGSKGKLYTKSNNIVYFQDGAGNEIALTGQLYSLANTYVSGSGTVGADNTAQTVKTVVIPANTLTQVGDRLRVRVYFKGDDGGNITLTNTVNTVTIATATDGGGADWFMTECWLHYIDNTHANIAEEGARPAMGAASAENVAGFTWDAAQDVDCDQNQVASNHIIVFCVFMDVFPKGVN